MTRKELLLWSSAWGLVLSLPMTAFINFGNVVLPDWAAALWTLGLLWIAAGNLLWRVNSHEINEAKSEQQEVLDE